MRGGRAFAALLLLLPLSIGLLLIASPSLAGCSSGQVSVSPRTVRPGQAITIAGKNFVCATSSSSSEAAVVHFGVRFVQGLFEQTLGAVDTGNAFTLSTHIPLGANNGIARIDVLSSDFVVGTSVRVIGANVPIAHSGEASVNEILFFAALCLLTGMLARAWANAPA